jgi:hypothetical protein
MKKFIFTQLNISKMSIENLHNLVKSTIQAVLENKGKFGEMGKSVFSLLRKSYEKFIIEVNSKSKTLYSEEMLIDDVKSDKLVKEIKQIIAQNINNQEDKKRNAAHNLDFFFTPYLCSGFSFLLPQFNLFSTMFTVFQADEELISSAKLIGIDMHIRKLESLFLNLNADDRYVINQTPGKLIEFVADERNALIENYLLFCTYMEESASLSNNNELHTLFYTLDKIRCVYRVQRVNTLEKTEV